MLTISLSPPVACSDGDIAAFQDIVLEGGEVDRVGLLQRIARADHLAFAFFDHNFVGVGALKCPNSGYRKSVFMKSGTLRSFSDFPLELGWVYVRPQFRTRGISGRLVEELIATSRSQNVFATSRTDNQAMHKSLERSGFVRDGKPYPSVMRAETLQLFVRVDAKPALAPHAADR